MKGADVARPPLCTVKITYVEVKNNALPEGDNAEGWAVVVNGCLVAKDSSRDTLTCGEVAENLALALGAPLEEHVVEVSGPWDWERDVLPKLGADPESPVLIYIQDDIQALADPRNPKLPRKVRDALGRGRVTPDVVRQAAEIARNTILEYGYWDIAMDALEAAVDLELGRELNRTATGGVPVPGGRELP